MHDRKTGEVTRVSVDSAGAEAIGGDNHVPSISANGRFVAFESESTSLVGDDSNGVSDVFVHDRKNGKTKRVSVRSDGAQANGDAFSTAISANGRFVAFESTATNLVAGDTNGLDDIFVHDRKTGETTRVSVDSNGSEALGGDSRDAAISASGRFVAFASNAVNLVPGDTNGKRDVFVHDRKTGQTTRVSVDSTGAQEGDADSDTPTISANGRFVAFDSDATNLGGVDSNSDRDIFVHDRKNGTTTRVSVDSAGVQSSGGDSDDPAISAKGRFVTFRSSAVDLVSDDTNSDPDIFVHDRKTGETTRASVDSAGTQANGGGCDGPAISAKGRFVAFGTVFTGLVTGDTNALEDVILRDRK